MSNHTMGYMAHKAEQKRKEQEYAKKVNDCQNQAFLQSTLTRHDTIPDMKSAYQAVQDGNYKPTEAEIHYRRYTSGRCIDKS